MWTLHLSETHRHRVAGAWRLGLIAICLNAPMHGALGQEAQIRKALADRLPQFPAIDEVTSTPIAGLYEVRSGATVFYTDARGDHLFRGEILDTRSQTNLTEARIAKLSAIDFDKLPLQDAIVSRHGQGTRKLAVFADPDCAYCKRLESTLEGAQDITIYTFLMPILGPGSLDKGKAIWCSRDKNLAWREWMLQGKLPAAQPDCDTSALDRNLALSGKHSIRGTPALVFLDGTRVSGALSAGQLELRLTQHQSASTSPPKDRAP